MDERMYLKLYKELLIAYKEEIDIFIKPISEKGMTLGIDFKADDVCLEEEYILIESEHCTLSIDETCEISLVERGERTKQFFIQSKEYIIKLQCDS